MKKQKLKPLKYTSFSKIDGNLIFIYKSKNEACENYYRVNDKFGDGRGDY